MVMAPVSLVDVVGSLHRCWLGKPAMGAGFHLLRHTSQKPVSTVCAVPVDAAAGSLSAFGAAPGPGAARVATAAERSCIDASGPSLHQYNQMPGLQAAASSSSSTSSCTESDRSPWKPCSLRVCVLLGGNIGTSFMAWPPPTTGQARRRLTRDSASRSPHTAARIISQLRV